MLTFKPSGRISFLIRYNGKKYPVLPNEFSSREDAHAIIEMARFATGSNNFDLLEIEDMEEETTGAGAPG